MAKSVCIAMLAFPLLVGCASGQSGTKDAPVRPTTREARAQLPPPKAKPKPKPAADEESAAPTGEDQPPKELLSDLAGDLDDLPARLAAMKAKEGATPPSRRNAPPSSKRSTAEPIRWSASTSEPAGRPAPPAAATPTPKQPTSPAAPTSAGSVASPELRDALAAAIQNSIATSGGGKPVAKALAAAAGALTDPEAPFDVTHFGQLDEEEKVLVERFHDACQTVGRDLASGKPAAEAAGVLAAALAAAKEPDPLVIPKVELCTRVDGFGKVTPIDNKRFLPGKAIQVILYTEVDRFSSEQNDKGEWSTRLATKVAIYAKHDGTQVWTRDWQGVADTSSVRRGDFFICEKVTLNEYLTVGTYILRTTVRDEKTGAVAEKSVEFQMVADPTVASR